MRWIFGLLLLVNVALYAFVIGVKNTTAQIKFVAPNPVQPSFNAEMQLRTLDVRNTDVNEDEPASPYARGDLEVSVPAAISSGRDAGSHPQEPLVDDERKCFKIGPLDGESHASRIAQELGLSSEDWRFLPAVSDVSALYWVFLPPLTNRDLALAELRKLQSMGIESFLVSEGADKNAISLGSFKRHEAAENLLQAVAEQGFKADIREKNAGSNTVWMLLRISGRQAYTLAGLSEVKKKESFFCEKFASYE